MKSAILIGERSPFPQPNPSWFQRKFPSFVTIPNFNINGWHKIIKISQNIGGWCWFLLYQQYTLGILSLETASCIEASAWCECCLDKWSSGRWDDANTSLQCCLAHLLFYRFAGGNVCSTWCTVWDFIWLKKKKTYAVFLPTNAK